MNYSKVIFPLLCILLFQFCNQKEKDEVFKDIQIIEISREFLVSGSNEHPTQALDTIDLERSGNPPLTAIQDIAFAKDFIFLVDNRKGLLKFDYEGNFLQTIGKKGEGPDEYNVPAAIYLDENNNRVLLAVWEKMAVNSYDLDGNFIATSKKLPGRPISFYKENDKVLVIQEGIESFGKGTQTVLVSFIEPTTLEFKSQETPLYSFYSRFYRIHSFLNAFGKQNDKTLFYFPRVRFEGITNQKDTIYRMEENHLYPEYLLDFTGFATSDTLGIALAEINDGYASMLLGYKKKSYHLTLDLENRTPKFSTKLPIEGYSIEEFPKHIHADIYYTIIRDQEASEEKNPKIILSSLSYRN